MKNTFFGIYVIVTSVLIGSLLYVVSSIKKDIHEAIQNQQEVSVKYLKTQEELTKFKIKVTILEESVGPREKKWAKVKKVRSVIQADMNRVGIGQNMNIADITEIATNIVDASDEFDVPISLVAAVIRTESAYNINAVSPTGAKGFMQILDSTAEEIAFNLGMKYHNTHKAKDNIRMGTFYLWKMIKRFRGDVELAVRAYNAGPICVDKVLAKVYSDYPEETRKYIVKVMENKKMFEDAGL